MENANTRQYLDTVRQQVLKNLRMLQGVQMEAVPHDPEAAAAEADPDVRPVSGAAEHPGEHF